MILRISYLHRPETSPELDNVLHGFVRGIRARWQPQLQENVREKGISVFRAFGELTALTAACKRLPTFGGLQAIRTCAASWSVALENGAATVCVLVSL